MEEQENTTIAHIVESIRQAGYEPYDQLTAYLLTRDERYITRHGDARNQVKQIEWGRLARFVYQLR